MQASVLVTYLLGRRIVGERPAFWGALLLTVSPLFLRRRPAAGARRLLTLWITLALLTAYLAQARHRCERAGGSLPRSRAGSAC